MTFTNLYFITGLIQHSGDHLGENPEYVIFMNNSVSLTSISLQFALIFGLLGVTICIFITSILHKILINNFFKDHPFEKIVYKFHPSALTILPAEFFCCSFFGVYMVPLLIFNELIHIDMVTKENLIFYALFTIVPITGCILMGSYTLILTNNKIIGISFGGLVKNTLCSFRDIKTIRKTSGGWEIIFKDDNILPLKGHPKAKKFYEKLKEWRIYKCCR